MIRTPLTVLLFAGAITAVTVAQTAPPAADGTPAPPTSGGKFPLMGEAPPAPAARVLGELAVKAVQASPGGKPIGAVPATIQFVHRERVVDRREVELDEHGVTMLDDIDISMGVQPVVAIQYGGVTYQRAGEVLDASNPRQVLEIPCYDVTGEEPDWTVSMHHVVLTRVAEGLAVTEVFVLNNPDERTWTGAPHDHDHAGAEGGEPRKVTTEFGISAGAEHVTLGRGFHDWCCTTLENNRLVNHLPLLPGSTELSYSYLLTGTNGEPAISLHAPAAVERMMVMVPEEIEVRAVDGLSSGPVQDMGETRVQYYLAENRAAGDLATLSLAGFAGTDARPAGTAAVTGSMKILAAVGAGVILLLALAVILLKSPRSADAH